MFTVKYVNCQKISDLFYINILQSWSLQRHHTEKTTYGIFKVQIKIVSSSVAGMDIYISFHWLSRVNAIFLLICVCGQGVLLYSTTDIISCGRRILLLICSSLSTQQTMQEVGMQVQVAVEQNYLLTRKSSLSKLRLDVEPKFILKA